MVVLVLVVATVIEVVLAMVVIEMLVVLLVMVVIVSEGVDLVHSHGEGDEGVASRDGDL